MSLQIYMDNGQTLEDYIKQEVKKALRNAWTCDYRNFPPYGDGKLPEYLK